LKLPRKKPLQQSSSKRPLRQLLQKSLLKLQLKKQSLLMPLLLLKRKKLDLQV
jgi:hypothetical protein